MFNVTPYKRIMMQNTNNIMMIRPSFFRYNDETAINNYYQKELRDLTDDQIHEKAIREFNSFVSLLESIGVNVIVIEDTDEYDTPDAIFPNNWISFHATGQVVLYPMCAENRRKERREDILSELEDKFNFEIGEVKDFTFYEENDKFLEGTGSMVLDRENKICYTAISIRTDKGLVNNFCEEFGYMPVCFTANQNINGSRLPIYHTNVMMCIADQFVIICLDSIDDKHERNKVESILKESDKEIIEISEYQKNEFAGNMLQVIGDQPYLIMSDSAYNSLLDIQISKIEYYCPIISTSLDIIETCGGGSARCMMAEIFLPKRK